jgi:hypothetical protein
MVEAVTPMHIKRASIRLCLLLSCILAYVTTCMSAEKRMPIVNSVQDEGLTVIDATSPAFMAEVAKFLDPSEIAKASFFLPYSIVLVNNTERYLWGFTVIYTFPDRVSGSGKPWRYIVAPSAGTSDRSRMLEPGASYLITPVNDFQASIDATGKRRLRPYLDEGMERIINLFESEHASGRIEVSIDSIIVEDGTLVGPDAAGTLDKIDSRFRAIRDLSASLRSLGGEDLRKQLLLNSGAGLGVRDEYSRFREERAQSLLELLNRDGEYAVAAALQQMRESKWFTNSERIRRRQQ